MGIPRWIHLIFLVLTVIALIPPVVIARARVTKSTNPRIHPIPDMDNQKKYKAQAFHPLYGDGRASRYPVAETVARGELRDDLHYHQGWERSGDGIAYYETFPAQVTVDRAFLERGRDRYGIYCSPCHGFSGHGDGMVARRASIVAEATWNFDLDLHTEERRGRAVGHLYNTITNGNNNMAPYRYQVKVADRWAIAAYVRALQTSEYRRFDGLPADLQARARQGALPPAVPIARVGLPPKPQAPNGGGTGTGDGGGGN